MKKYVTFVADEETSKLVQEVLFKVGFEWAAGGQKVMYGEYPFLLINIGAERTITVRSAIEGLYDAGRDFDYINHARILAHPSKLDGAKQPEKQITVNGKEYSESTILSALRQYVD